MSLLDLVRINYIIFASTVCLIEGITVNLVSIQVLPKHKIKI